jgi:hypothetical protein
MAVAPSEQPPGGADAGAGELSPSLEQARELAAEHNLIPRS